MNMDVKDLIAKLKSKGGKGSSKSGGSSLTAFFDKNPKMKIIIPIVLILISALVSVSIIVTTKTSKVDSTPVNVENGDQVDVLPQGIIVVEEDEVGSENVFDEVAIANAKYTAMIYNSEGYYTAQLETKSNIITVKVGDYIDGSSWLVEDISEEKVVLSLGDKKVEIKRDV